MTLVCGLWFGFESTVLHEAWARKVYMDQPSDTVYILCVPEDCKPIPEFSHFHYFSIALQISRPKFPLVSMALACFIQCPLAMCPTNRYQGGGSS